MGEEARQYLLVAIRGRRPLPDARPLALVQELAVSYRDVINGVR
jgi:hypothetical protein